MDKQYSNTDYGIYAYIAAALVVCATLTGCGGLIESTKEKQINFDSQVYGFKAVMIDPATGSTSPTGEFGFGSINYRSMPVEKGQPFYARYTVKSLWSSDAASETIIWVGRAAEKSVLEFEGIPDGMFKISADGVKTGSTLTVKPDNRHDAIEADRSYGGVKK